MAENTRIKMQRLKRSKSRLQRRQPTPDPWRPLLPLRHLELPISTGFIKNDSHWLTAEYGGGGDKA
jgi:hypothetical protein